MPTFTSITPNNGVGGTLFSFLGTGFNALFANNAIVEVKAQIGVQYINYTPETGSTLVPIYDYQNALGTHDDTHLNCVAPNYNGRGSMNFYVFRNNVSMGGMSFTYPTSTITSSSLTSNNVIIPGSTITINGVNLQYLSISLVYFAGMTNLMNKTITDITYNNDYSQLTFILPNDPFPTQSHSISLNVSTGNGWPSQSSTILYTHPIQYPNPTIQSIAPGGGYGGWTGNGTYNTLTIYGQNFWGMGYAKVGSEFCSVISVSTDGSSMSIYKPTGNLNGSSSGYVSIGTSSTNILATSTQWYTCNLTPFIESFYPQSGAAGTTVDIYGYNLARINSNNVWVTPNVSFNGVNAASVTIIDMGRIRVTAPLSYTGRIVVNNNVTGSFTSQIDYVYPPVPITVGYSTSILGGGGSITSIQYSKNGGAWTTMTRTLNINNTDQMRYRATFTKANGYSYMDVQITVPSVGNCMNDSSSTSPITRSTWDTFRNLNNYTVYFGVNSYGTGGGGGIH